MFFGSEKIFYLENENLYSKNDIFEKKENIISEDVLSFIIENDSLFVLKKSGFIYEKDYSGEIKKIVNQRPININTGKYSLKVKSDLIFLQTNNELYFINSNLEEFKKIHDPVKNVVFYQDRKLLFHNNHEVWIISLNHLSKNTTREELDKKFLDRFSEEIEKYFWINNNYLIFGLNGKIKISESDTENKLNTITIASFEDSQFHWNGSEKKLYVLENGSLFVSEKLIQ